jgi:uncharacterized protein YkwD
MTVIRLRALFVSALGALIVVAAVSAAAAPAGSGDRAISSNATLERSIVSEINALRASRGLPRLVISRGLALAARGHSRDMALTGYFSHTSRDGRAFDERVRRYYGSKGYRSWRAGENLLWASPEIDGDRAVQMWLDSPAHRQILLSRSWREIGLSAVHTAAGRRVYEGMEVTIVTADFGARVR